MNRVARQKLKLLCLIAVFALPMLVAWVMVTWNIGIPQQRTAHGELDPAIPYLHQWPLERAWVNSEVETATWMLAFDCERECAAQADEWWRVHRALGKEAPRISRLRIGGEIPLLPGEESRSWRERPAWASPGGSWILDPRGRPVLAFAAGTPAKAVLEDINHLLRMNPKY
ncbi:hypothetical protein R5M92_04415 [Halomonas sp. Bachu 37]|uniref:hypothetical protein n=1 Tax=Halomonas kashgarensis TaxID=3084920 RepID=UPI003217F087